MKKLVSCILALSVMITTLLFGTASVTAAECDNSAVADIDMWNHEFKNEISGEVMWAIDELADTDTVAIAVGLHGKIDDIFTFADKNDRLDEVIYNDDGSIEYSEELMADYSEYVESINSQDISYKRQLINNEYSVSEIKYFASMSKLICVSTKAQILSLADADITVRIDLADETYYDEQNQITWEDYFHIEQQTREYIESTTEYSCAENEYDVYYYHNLIDVSVMFVFNCSDLFSANNALLRDGNIVWIGTDTPQGIYYYSGGMVKNVAELYRDGVIDTEMLYDLGGRFYGDTDWNKTVNVNDVTYLQRVLSGSVDYEFGTTEETVKLFCDFDNNDKVDVNDVTALQKYISMAVSVMPS
ncbi:MAG: hypothetical protein ACI4HK_05030 [Ruminococcus sp.]